MNPILSRQERFQRFQSLLQELRESNDSKAPASTLTRLYNGMTEVISNAEAEIKRLREVADSLTTELANLKATVLEVSQTLPIVEGERSSHQDSVQQPLRVPQLSACSVLVLKLGEQTRL